MLVRKTGTNARNVGNNKKTCILLQRRRPAVDCMTVTTIYSVRDLMLVATFS
jgi:hypothetical protein